MPVFGQSKKTPNDRRRSSRSTPPKDTRTTSPKDNRATPPKDTRATPPKDTRTTPPPVPPPSHWSNTPPPNTVVPPRRELVFHCQLAHGSATIDVKDFSNVKELYGKIAEAFRISVSEIVFCTLNTHKADMSRLLGGQIGLEDFIFVHIRGPIKEVTLNKTEPALGLTITDNGAGVAFVKRLREGSIAQRHPQIEVGDMILSINGRKMDGCRHFEIAKLLKDIPLSSQIVLRLSDTKKAFESIAPRGASRGAMAVPVMDGDTGKLEEMVSRGEGRATLRLKKDGQAVVEEVKPWEGRAASRVDDLLETFLGIRDLELAQTMVDLARQKTTLQQFSAVMSETLGEFEFPDDFVTDVWSSVLRAKAAIGNS